MGKRRVDLEAPFQGLRTAAKITGLSEYFLRRGCKNGTIPHIMVGAEYRVNVPQLLHCLETESAG